MKGLLRISYGVFLGCFAVIASATDGVTLITQAAGLAGGVTPGDAPGFPITISVHGSYRLASSLSVPHENVDAIEITAENVTLDLNGFAIGGWGRPGTGRGVFSKQLHVVVRNGIVAGMGDSGVVLLGSESVVSNLIAHNNHKYGLRVGTGVVENNVASDNGDAIYVGREVGLGIVIGDHSIVRGNRAAGIQGRSTITVGCFALIHDNSAERIRVVGGGGCVLRDNNAEISEVQGFGG